MVALTPNLTLLITLYALPTEVPTTPTSQTPSESMQCATAPVENFPPCACLPDHTPPTTSPRHSATLIAAQTSLSHLPSVQSATDSSPSRSCTPETHLRPSEDHRLSSSYRTAEQIRP